MTEKTNNKQKNKKVDSHGLTPVALKNESANSSFGIHPRAHTRGPLLIWIVLALV